MAMVYVQNKDGKPLMPTTRYCYVRLLLKEKKARVVCTTPFTIQLNYDTPDVTQDLNGTPNYYNSTKGARVLTKRCALLAKNAGMVFIPA